MSRYVERSCSSHYSNPAEDYAALRAVLLTSPQTWRERSATSVRVAHVRLPHNTNVWAFSRQEMLNMVGALDNNTHDIFATSGTSEWFVWGSVPEHLVVNQHEL